jgi:S-adenosylmethionine hydrolase
LASKSEFNGMSQRAAAFAPSGVVTLTTDFGHKDPFVGVMKGRLVGRFPSVVTIDLTHEVLAHWPAEAGFWLARSFRYFPAGTVHVAVVDPGVGSARDIAAIEAEGHVFLAPDNGLLAAVVEAVETATLRRIEPQVLERIGIGTPSATFHGRDVFAPLAAEIAAGRLAPALLGAEVPELIPGWLEDPAVGPAQVAGSVVTIDHFGNVISNIDVAHLAHLSHPAVRVGGRELPLRRTYSDVRPGEYLALVNSFGVVEVARAERSAAEGLGLERGAPVLVVTK